LNKVTICEQDRKRAETVKRAVEQLREFCSRTDLSQSVSVQTALLKFNQSQEKLKSDQRKLEECKDVMRRLSAQGLDVADWKEFLQQLGVIGYTVEGISGSELAQMKSEINAKIDANVIRINGLKNKKDELLKSATKIIGDSVDSMVDVKRSLSELKEKTVATEQLRDNLLSFSESFPIAGDRPLSEWIIVASGIRKVAVELQLAIGRERQAATMFEKSIERKDKLSEEFSRLKSLVEKYENARQTLGNIRSNHSLESAMKDALSQNRDGIETIFSRIHSPDEFKGLGSNYKTLVRKENDEVAELSQISTGQRAAFALSIFLAKNAQLKNAPPVVLIDDPIAHVDDLNSLSFLDYLREIVLSGSRQIFFATANTKLASLFERKFDFLGAEGFKRFDLNRTA
jgi:hypothetical protein